MEIKDLASVFYKKNGEVILRFILRESIQGCINVCFTGHLYRFRLNPLKYMKRNLMIRDLTRNGRIFYSIEKYPDGTPEMILSETPLGIGCPNMYVLNADEQIHLEMNCDVVTGLGKYFGNLPQQQQTWFHCHKAGDIMVDHESGSVYIRNASHGLRFYSKGFEIEMNVEFMNPVTGNFERCEVNFRSLVNVTRETRDFRMTFKSAFNPKTGENIVSCIHPLSDKGDDIFRFNGDIVTKIPTRHVVPLPKESDKLRGINETFVDVHQPPDHIWEHLKEMAGATPSKVEEPSDLIRAATVAIEKSTAEIIKDLEDVEEPLTEMVETRDPTVEEVRVLLSNVCPVQKSLGLW